MLRRRDGALVDTWTPYERDVSCQLFVAAFPGGASLQSVGDAMGITREAVRLIEAQALRQLERFRWSQI